MTVSPEGVVYASFMVSVTVGNDTYTYPVVDVSGNEGATFAERAQLNPKVANNWGDRDFIAVGPHGRCT